MTTRRQFLQQLTVTSLSGLCARSLPAAGVQESADRPGRCLRVLVLGGTRYLGPVLVREFLGRNYAVTLFNRGRTNPKLFPNVEQLRGNRFPELGKGLAALEGTRTWDVVVDLPAYYPRLVEATSRLLADRVEHYIVMSSISVYRDFRTIGLTETAPVRSLANTFREDPDLIEGDWGSYGGRKAACERIADEIFEGRTSTVRASGMVGENSDDTTRYWPARVARGGTMVAPGDGNDPYQTVDVGDVSRLIAMLAERRLRGVFNATGPAVPTTFSDYLDACMKVTASRPNIRWLDEATRRRFAVTGDETPQWAPAAIVPGFQRISSAKARAEGWQTRPLTESIESVWRYQCENYPADYDFQNWKTGFSPRREHEILSALA